MVHAQPIYVGTFSYHTYRDPTTNAPIDSFLEPFFVGMYSAIQAVNTAGGIHGKQIQLIECETGFIHQKYLDCMDHSLSFKMLVVHGFWFPETFRHTLLER